MSIVFFGSSKFVIPILEVLQKNFELKLVVTTEKNATDAVPAYCIENKIPYLSVQQFNNSAIEQLRNLKSPAAVLADFGLLIPKEILNAFPKGIINIHPSLLPKYRGPTPVQTAILNGEKTTGITIMKLDKEIDHGPILTQTKEKIFEKDTAESLYEKLFKKSAEIIVPIIRIIELNQPVPEISQDHSKATFTKTLKREDGLIDINNPPSPEKLHRMIRAYFPWPGVWTKWKMPARQRIRLQAKSGGENARWKILKFLPNNKLQVESKKPMSYKDFANGYPQLKNVKFIRQLLAVEKP